MSHHFRRIVRLKHLSGALVRRFNTSSEANGKVGPNYFKGLALPILGAGGMALAGFLVSNYSSVKDITKDVKHLLSHALDTSQVVQSSAGSLYVHRAAVESELEYAFTAPPTGLYRIVYGAKGAGKSEAVDHIAIGRKAVVKLSVNEAHSKNDIISLLTKKLLREEQVTHDLDELTEAIKRCQEVPTIIFDVERGGPANQAAGMEAVRSLAKALAMHCRCLIVLSEATAVTEFGRDDDRERFIFVGELTVEEAKALLKNKGATLTEQEMQYVFESIGTNAATLVSLASEVPSRCTLQEFVANKFVRVKKHLTTFPFQGMLKVLKERPGGVQSSFFLKVEEKGVPLADPFAVMMAARRCNVILYDPNKDVYQMISTAHKTALKSYNPP